MAVLEKRGNSWRAQIRRKGVSVGKSFPKKVLAENWITTTEAEIIAGTYQKTVQRGDDNLFGVIADKVIDRIEQIKRSTNQKPMGSTAVRTMRFVGESLGEHQLADLDYKVLRDWGFDRKVAPSTLARDFTYIGQILSCAEDYLDKKSPLSDFQKAKRILKKAGAIDESQQRDRRVTDQEIDLINAHKGKNSSFPLKLLADFAVVTTMRRGEQVGSQGIRWEDLRYDGQAVVIRQRKHPKKAKDEVVPLLPEAQKIIEVMRNLSGHHQNIFAYSAGGLTGQWIKAKNLAGIPELRWHDLRHEGISRLFDQGYDIPEVALFSGHKDWNSLKRYTHQDIKKFLQRKGLLK